MSSPEGGARDSLFLDLEVPCLCNYSDYCLRPASFLDIPESHGLHWDTAHYPEFCSLRTSEEAASFLQGWLFFAMLNQVSSLFGVKLQATDFIVEAPLPYTGSDPEPSVLVSGREFSKYLWLWTGAICHKSLDEQRACITNIKAFIDVLHRVANAWLEQEYIPVTSTFDRILLSIVLLGESLAYTMSQVFFPAMAQETFKTPYQWKCSRYLHEQLIKVGWCEGELPLLLGRCQPTVLLYLSSIERMRQDKDHSRCEDVAGCLVNRLEPDTYQPSHAVDCPDKVACIMVQVSVEEVSNLITTGSIPLMKVNSNRLGATTLQIQSFKFNDKNYIPSYVAISHVWSDGMGNPRVNAIRSCQLRRIQNAVDALYDSDTGREVEGGTENQPVPFWIDTLCVPLQSHPRSIAVARMAKTYFHAEKVLVMDNWLCSHRADAHVRETLIKIAHSDWNTRLWTFQEGLLAQTCYFQLKDRALSMDELKNTPKVNDNLQEVSRILLKMGEKDILRGESTMNLLWALTNIDPYGVEILDEYASLPPQSDPEREALRLHAIKQHGDFWRAWKSYELWAPVLAQAEVQGEADDVAPFANARTRFDQAELLRAHMETRTFDPLLAHGIDAIYRLRGFSYEASASRSHDLAGGAHSQLTAFTSSPAAVLRDVSRGLPGRITSKMEDETICLGGVIGLDVYPFLDVSVRESERNKEALERVCAERMKRFLLSVKTLPSSVLFWNTNRMAEYPWRWASRSFLERNACTAMYYNESAQVTSQGLMARYRGISIKLNQTSAIQKRFRTLRLQHVDPGTGKALPFDDLSDHQQTWMCLELLEPSPTERKISWYDLFAEAEDTQLALVTFAQQKLDGALVSILRTEQDVVFAKYMANVLRVSGDDEPEYLEAYVDATWMGWKTWCIG